MTQKELVFNEETIKDDKNLNPVLEKFKLFIEKAHSKGVYDLENASLIYRIFADLKIGSQPEELPKNLEHWSSLIRMAELAQSKGAYTLDEAYQLFSLVRIFRLKIQDLTREFKEQQELKNQVVANFIKQEQEKRAASSNGAAKELEQSKLKREQASEKRKQEKLKTPID